MLLCSIRSLLNNVRHLKLFQRLYDVYKIPVISHIFKSISICDTLNQALNLKQNDPPPKNLDLINCEWAGLGTSKNETFKKVRYLMRCKKYHNKICLP